VSPILILTNPSCEAMMRLPWFATLVALVFSGPSNASEPTAPPRDLALGQLAGEPDGAAQVSAIAIRWDDMCKAKGDSDSCYQAAYASYLAASLNLESVDTAAPRLVACAQSLARVRLDPTMAAEADALLAGCYGLSIAINPAKGRSLGPESARLLEQAMQAEPENPRVLLLAAIRLQNTPEAWGGDKKRARELLQQALPLIQRQKPAANRPAWGEAHIRRLLADS
jgi:hypothetical protein